MADKQPPEDSAEAAEAAATRRRWINLAEILGVIAVLISGLALWNGYQERTGAEAEKAAARREASAEAQTLLLRATPDREGNRLSLAAVDPGQVIQSQTIAFPTALAAAPIDTLIEPRLEADWFERGLLRARDAADQAAQVRGDERVPVAITTTFFSGGAVHRDSGIYDIGYRIDGGGLLGRSEVRLRGLSRIESAPANAAQARLDAIWQARMPAAPPS